MTRRVTIEFEDDVAVKLEREAERVGKTRDEIVNEVMRDGLPEGEFYVRDLGARPGVNFDCAWELLGQWDDEIYAKKSGES